MSTGFTSKMEKSSYLSCGDNPWQSTITCMLTNFKDEMLAANQSSKLIHQTTPKKLTTESTYLIFVILTFVGLAVLGTSISAYEFFFKEKNKKIEAYRNGHSKSKVKKENALEDYKSLLKCFCLLRNGRTILSTDTTEGQITFFQGLRFISNVIVIFVHTGLAILSSLRNTEDLKPLFDMRITQTSMQLIFTVDVFFLISGYLNAYSFFHKYNKSNGNISLFNFYLKRFLRLTPVYIIILAFQVTLLSYMGTGIIWPSYDTNPACLKDWWWNLLYINNFRESAKQCMVWCWYLAADMQFYLLSPLFMIPLIRWPRIGYALILACITGSCVASFMLTYQYNLIDGFSRFEFHLADSKNYVIKFWEYFDRVYSKPYTRISPYLVSILLANYLYKKRMNKETIRNSARTLFLGWSLTALFTWICYFSLYKQEEILIVTALYNGCKHLLFSSGFAWIIYLCLTGQLEFLRKCLSWKYFLPFSRLSYCAYLIHPLPMQKLFLSMDDLLDYNISSLVELTAYFFALTYIAAFIAAILFEFPVLNLQDWFEKRKGTKKAHLN